MSRRCDAHGMKLDLFCLGHSTAVCARCAQDDHFKCPQFVPFENAKKYLSSSLQDGSREQQSTKETVVLNDEENTFTKYVKMAVETGEENTFTKYLKATGTRTYKGRVDNESINYGNPLTSSRDFQLEDGVGEYNLPLEKTNDQSNSLLDYSGSQDNNTLDTYRPSSADLQNVRENVLYNVVKSPKSKRSTATTQSEVGQLLEDVKKFSKGLTSRDDVGITLDDLNRKVDRALSEIAEHFATTQKQKSSIEFQIKEIRARLNKHLDDMESMLLNSLELKFRQVEENVSNTIEKLQKGKTEIHHMKTGTARNDNSPFQANTILAIRESDKQVRRMKRSINALTENIYAIDMDVKINQDLNMFIDEIRTFGEVTVNTRLNPKFPVMVENRRNETEKTEPKTTRTEIRTKTTPTNKRVVRSDSKRGTTNKHKRPLAQKREIIETTQRLSNVQVLPENELGQHLEMMDEPLPEIVMTSRSGISGIRIMQKKKVKIEHKWTSNVSNCKMLPNGRLIFIDTENKRLVIHNKDTYVYRNLRVSDPPRDFIVLDSDRVAVTFGIYIEILNIVTSRIEKRIHLEFFECNGISFMDGKFYIYGIFEGYLLSRHGIQVMDIHGRVEDRLPITRVQTIHHSIDTWQGRIYYTGYSSISCCTTSGEELWVFKHDRMDRPKCLSVDSYGNVFASYENENKIVVISVDGQCSKEFELKKYDLHYGQEPRPISVYFDTIESALIMCNANKDHSVLYFVKYD